VERNGKIVRLAETSTGPVLILVNHIEHGNDLFSFLDALGEDVIFLNGGSKKRNEKMDHRIIIATSIFDEGIDIPHLKHLIIAAGGKSAIRTTQRIGRVLRRFPGKNVAMVHDFVDNCRWLKKHYLERRAIYEQDFEIVNVE
jgi:superfamily II DNA or RNA helicase